MDHIAIMKKSWGLLPKIINGEKTVESRWYKARYAPWNRIKAGEDIYFKSSGEPVSVKAEVSKVLQFKDVSEKKRKKILKKYGKKDLDTKDILPEIEKYTKNKDYCILVFFEKVKSIKPFKINKSGFGAMSAWLVVSNINKIKK